MTKSRTLVQTQNKTNIKQWQMIKSIRYQKLKKKKRKEKKAEVTVQLYVQLMPNVP